MLKPTTPMPDAHHHAPTHAVAPTARLTRRSLLHGAAGFSAGGLLGLAGIGPHAWAQSPAARPTTEEILGPFYPLSPPADQDEDMTVIAGTGNRALGQVLYLRGRVTDLRGQPVANADIQIWQANAAGRYTHPGDRNPAPLDPNFEGYARIRTAADGSWCLKTIKPGAYPTPVPGWMRPPHIHFDVRGRASRLATQMYFEDEALNAKDLLLQRASNPASLIARYQQAASEAVPGDMVAEWNIVLMAG